MGTLLIGWAEESIVPEKKAGHYSAYVLSGHVGHEGGDILTRNTITEINEMFSTR